MKTMLNKSRAFLLINTFILLLVSSCNDKRQFKREEGVIWNTLYHIIYESKTNLTDSIEFIFDEIGASISIFDKNSLVTKINQQDSVEIDSIFKTIYEESVKINKLTGGLFDPTVSPLITAWGFGPGHTLSSDTASIDSILNFVGIQKTRIEQNKLIKEKPGITFNFSAVAKGYGCDAVKGMMERNGVENLMIEIGGEIALAGISPSGKKWRISIDAPIDNNRDTSHDSYLIIEVTDCGIATSGNYRNYYEENGTKFGHTISPVTGRPVQTEILSATIISDSAMEADALATACMASGLEESKSLLKKAGAEGLLITTSGPWMTDGFKHLIIEEVSEPGKEVRN